MKFLIDEDLSPRVARYLCEEFYLDAIAVRDRGLLGSTDPEVLDYALTEDRILVTANIRDFEKFASSVEVHAGIVLVQEGDLLVVEQIELITNVIRVLSTEFETGTDLINRVLYISISGNAKFENLPDRSMLQ
jgi:predicted nuclease of predicted toxin-antitoxin system